MIISEETFYIFGLITSGISIFSCLWLFLLFRKLKKKSIPMKLILWISIFDFFEAIVGILSQFMPATHLSCIFIEFFIILCLWTSLFYSTALSVLSYYSLHISKPFDQQKYYRKAHMLIFPVCFIASLMPVFSFSPVSYQSVNGYFCSVVADPSLSDTLRIVSLVIYQILPVLPALVITFIYYILIVKYINEKIPKQIRQRKHIKKKNFVIFALVQLLVYLPHTISVVYGIIFEYDFGQTIGLILFCLQRLGGFANSLVYVILRTAKHKQRLGTSFKVSLINKDEDNGKLTA